MAESIDQGMVLRLSAQRALRGAVTPNLRAVSAEIRGATLHWRAIFATEPSEEERELLQVASTEVLADFPETEVRDYDEQLLVVAPPASLDHLAQLIYLRHE